MIIGDITARKASKQPMQSFKMICQVASAEGEWVGFSGLRNVLEMNLIEEQKKEEKKNTWDRRNYTKNRNKILSRSKISNVGLKEQDRNS